MPYADPEKNRECRRRYARANRKRMYELQHDWRIRNPEKVQQTNKACRAKKRAVDPLYEAVKAAKQRAKRKGIPFDLRSSDLVLPSHCPVLGIPLCAGTGTHAAPNSPSLDRIVPDLGYVRGNVLVISWRANDLRKNATVEELRQLANFYGSLNAA